MPQNQPRFCSLASNQPDVLSLAALKARFLLRQCSKCKAFIWKMIPGKAGEGWVREVKEASEECINEQVIVRGRKLAQFSSNPCPSHGRGSGPQAEKLGPCRMPRTCVGAVRAQGYSKALAVTATQFIAPLKGLSHQQEKKKKRSRKLRHF